MIQSILKFPVVVVASLLVGIQLIWLYITNKHAYDQIILLIDSFNEDNVIAVMKKDEYYRMLKQARKDGVDSVVGQDTDSSDTTHH